VDLGIAITVFPPVGLEKLVIAQSDAVAKVESQKVTVWAAADHGIRSMKPAIAAANLLGTRDLDMSRRCRREGHI
jgi:hypothetical protein